MRDALDSLAAAQERREPVRPPTWRPEWDTGLAVVADSWRMRFVVVCAGLLVVVAGVAVGLGPGPATPSCEPITYAFQGSPPDRAVAEFRLATREIRRRSGLLFVEDDPNAAKLLVRWSDRAVADAASSPVASDHGRTALLGVARGHWRSMGGGRQLVAAAIEVDGRISWPLGLERGDGIAAVFVHELGHVVGLAHSPDPTSFMHRILDAQAPRWTAHDLEQLERAGEASGCRAPADGGQA